MKKVLLSIITFMYIATSSGIAMNVHYCMGKRAGIDFINTVNKKCGKCGMTEKQGKGCCKDEHKLIKLSVNHTQPVVAHFNFAEFSVPAFLPQAASYQEAIFNSLAANYYAAHSPPDISVKLNILNCIFRI